MSQTADGTAAPTAAFLCMRCACELNEVGEGAICRECGLEAEKSVPFCRAAGILPRRWLHDQLWGVHLLLLGILGIKGIALLEDASVTWGTGSSVLRDLITTTTQVGLMVPASLFVIGCWRLASPDPKQGRTLSLRLLRIAALSPLAAAGIAAASWPIRWQTAETLVLVAAIPSLLLPGLIGLRLGRISALCAQRHLSRIAAVIGWAGTFVLTAFAAMALVFAYWPARVDPRIAGSPLWMISLIAWITAWMLLLIGADLLLLRARRIAGGGRRGSAGTGSTLRCVRCAYDLRDLDRAGRCPECGLLIERSVNLGTELRESRPAWIRSLSISIWLLFLTLVPAALIVPAVVIPWPYRDESASVLILVTTVVFTTGNWLLTRPENPYAQNRPMRAVELAIRWISLGILGCALLALLPVMRRPEFAPIGLAFCFPLVLPYPVLLFVLLRRLAFRVMDTSLGELCTIVGWGLSLTMVGAVVLPGIASPAGDLLMTSLALACALLFLFWAAGLLFYFAAAFHRAARAARAAWREAEPVGAAPVI